MLSTTVGYIRRFPLRNRPLQLYQCVPRRTQFKTRPTPPGCRLTRVPSSQPLNNSTLLPRIPPPPQGLQHPLLKAFDPLKAPTTRYRIQDPTTHFNTCNRLLQAFSQYYSPSKTHSQMADMETGSNSGGHSFTREELLGSYNLKKREWLFIDPEL